MDKDKNLTQQEAEALIGRVKGDENLRENAQINAAFNLIEKVKSGEMPRANAKDIKREAAKLEAGIVRDS